MRLFLLFKISIIIPIKVPKFIFCNWLPAVCIPITSLFSSQIGDPEEPTFVCNVCSNLWSNSFVILPDEMDLSLKFKFSGYPAK